MRNEPAFSSFVTVSLIVAGVMVRLHKRTLRSWQLCVPAMFESGAITVPITNQRRTFRSDCQVRRLHRLKPMKQSNQGRSDKSVFISVQLAPSRLSSYPRSRSMLVLANTSITETIKPTSMASITFLALEGDDFFSGATALSSRTNPVGSFAADILAFSSSSASIL